LTKELNIRNVKDLIYHSHIDFMIKRIQKINEVSRFFNQFILLTGVFKKFYEENLGKKRSSQRSFRRCNRLDRNHMVQSL